MVDRRTRPFTYADYCTSDTSVVLPDVFVATLRPGDALTTPLLPGLSLPLSELFAP